MGKKLPAPVCDFINGTIQATDYASDLAVDTSVAFATSLAALSLPNVSIPTIIFSSLVGQTAASNFLGSMMQPVKETIHNLTAQLQPDACRNAPIPIIPMGHHSTPAANPSQKINQISQSTTIHNSNYSSNYITNLIMNIGVSASHLQQLTDQHSRDLKDINVKLDKIIKWENQQDKLQDQQSRLQHFQDAQAICSSLSKLGKAIHCEELENGAKIVGVGVQIATGIAMCYVNPVMGGAMLIGSIAELIGIFSSPGPNPHQIILDQIGQLSEQLNAMYKDMAKLFDQNIKIQKIILEVIQQGFFSLSQLVKGEIGSIRANIQASFVRLETLQHSLSQQVASGYQQLYLKNFLCLQSQISDYIAGRQPTDNSQHIATNLNNAITTWSTRLSQTSLLNGANWRTLKSVSINYDFLNSVLNADPSITASEVLGFFDSNLPHPALWLTTVNLYCQLTGNFWNIDFDPAQRAAIQKKGEEIIHYCETLACDECAWDSILDEYYKALEQTLNTIEQFGMCRSQLWVANGNQKYATNGVSTITLDEKFSFLTDLTGDHFIKLFTTHKITKINLTPNANSLASLDLHVIAEKLTLENEIRCAVFLSLAEISIYELSSKRVQSLDLMVKIKFKAENSSINQERIIFTKSTDPSYQSMPIEEAINKGHTTHEKQFLVNFSVVDKAKGYIKNKIINFRSVIAEELYCGTVTDDPKSQVLLEQFKEALIHLEYCVRKLQHLLYFSGLDLKSSNAKRINEKIITVEKLKTLLQKGLEDSAWLDNIKQSLEEYNRLTPREIIKLTSYNYGDLHPITIAKRGIDLLLLNESTIQARRLQAPLFKHYLKLKQYQTDDSKRYIEEELNNIYTLLESTFAVKHKKSKSNISGVNKKSVNANDYKKYFLNFKNWSCNTALDRNFIGDSQIAENIFNYKDGWQISVKLTMNRSTGGWERNISILYHLAWLFNNKKPSLKPVALINYLMWRDGVEGIVKMIVDPLLAPHATGLLANKCASQDLESTYIEICKLQIEHLQDAYSLGCSLYSVIEYIVQSKAVDQLTKRYEALLEQLEGAANTLSNNLNPEVSDNDHAVYNRLFVTQHGASSTKLLDTLEAYQLCLKSYCEMILPYFSWKKTFSALKTKDKFLTYMKVDISSKKGLIQKINQYREEVKKANSGILELFDEIRELIQLRDALILLSTGQNNNVVSLEGTTLVILAESFKFGFDDKKAKILEAFLEIIPGINGINFKNEDFSKSKNLKCALNFIKRHPEIHTLRLHNCELTATVVQSCIPEFAALMHIHKLDLSSNPLIENNHIFCCALDTDRICQLLENMPDLSKLDLSDVKIDSCSLLTLNSFLKRNPAIHTRLEKIPHEVVNNTLILNKDLSHVLFNPLVYVGTPSLFGELSLLHDLIIRLQSKIDSYKALCRQPVKSSIFSSPINSGSFFTNNQNSPQSTLQMNQVTSFYFQ